MDQIKCDDGKTPKGLGLYAVLNLLQFTNENFEREREREIESLQGIVTV